MVPTILGFSPSSASIALKYLPRAISIKAVVCVEYQVFDERTVAISSASLFASFQRSKIINCSKIMDLSRRVEPYVLANS